MTTRIIWLLIIFAYISGCRVADKISGIDRAIGVNKEVQQSLKAVVTAKGDATVQEVASARDTITEEITANRDAISKDLKANHDAIATEVRQSAQSIAKAVTISNAAGDPWPFRIIIGSMSIGFILLIWIHGKSTPIAVARSPSEIKDIMDRIAFLEGK